VSADPETEGVRIESTLVTRMGDGSCVESTRDTWRAHLDDGARRNAKRARVPSLTLAELDWLPETTASEERVTRVPLGDQVVLGCDGSTGLHLSRLGSLTGTESAGGGLCGQQQDACSPEALTTAVAGEQRRIQEARHRLTIPVRCGAQADPGRHADIEMECVGEAAAMEAKSAAARSSDLPINCIARLRERAHSLSASQPGRSS